MTFLLEIMILSFSVCGSFYEGTVDANDAVSPMPQLPLLPVLRGCIIGEALIKYPVSAVLIPNFIFC